MNKLLKSAAALWLALAAAGAVEKRPNVLFLIADDLNCNLGAYGHYLVKTPNLDRLAAEGVLFENHYCQQSLCGPSRASFLTGLYPDQNNVRSNAILIRDRVPEVVTLPQHFMANGYTTARVGKLYHYNNPGDIGRPGHDDPASWNEVYYPSGRDKAEEDKIHTLVPGKFGATLSWLAAEGTDEEQTDGMVATQAIELMKKYRREGKPFFLGVGFYKPHTPYVAPKKYFEMYDKAKIVVPKVPAGYFETLPEPAMKSLLTHNEESLPEDTKKSAMQGYYAAISFMDANVGRVLKALEDLGLKENTIVFFTSDNGYHMGEHGHYQKMTLFEDGARVPLIISAPGMAAKGKRTKSLAELVDFYRTLSELAGLPEPPAYVQGRSLVPVLKDPLARVRDSALTRHSAEEGSYTLRTERYRFTMWGEGGPGMIELYDHASDPAEMRNLARDPEKAALVRELEGRLRERMAQAQAVPAGLKVLPEPSAQKKAGGKKGKGKKKAVTGG